MSRSGLVGIFSITLLLIWPLGPLAAEVNVAVAANFAAPMKVIAADFERKTGHKVIVAVGATGQFYAQIRNGAPFGVLLAADETTPMKLEKEGFAVNGSRFTYATGKLVLWSPQKNLVDQQGRVLREGKFERIAISNPKIAPYGVAAVQVLSKLGLMARIGPKIVEGSSIAQTFQFIVSENAQLGFIALSQVFENGQIKNGSGWIIPSELHEPIRQDAILLKVARDNPAAIGLLQYLRSDTVKNQMRSFGYEL